MYRIYFTSKMKKDVRRMQKRGKDLQKLSNILSILASGKKLPEKFCDHKLSGTLKGFRECHIEPDWLLVYMINDNALVLTATGTGSHADLFDM